MHRPLLLLVALTATSFVYAAPQRGSNQAKEAIQSLFKKTVGESSKLGNKMPLRGEEVAVLETDAGRIVLRFFKDKAPKHVANFKKLANSKFYDKSYFHRTIPGFMIQGGDPNTKNANPNDDGQGGPGWSVKAEFNDVKHVPGILSMARSNDPNSAGSQFFIMHGKADFLDGKYTAFGQVVSGLEIVNKIVKAPTVQDGQENSRPVKPIYIKTARIVKWK